MEVKKSAFTARINPRYFKSFGQKNGIIKLITIEQFTPRGPSGIQIAAPTTSDVSTIVDKDLAGINAAGKGETLQKAMNAAFGETVERYAFLFPPSDRLEWASYEEIRSEGEVIDYEYIDIYDREALAAHFQPFDRQTELPWTRGTNLLTGDSTYVPAERVWFRTGALDGIDYHIPGTSNGLAAGDSLLFSLTSSLYEVIERDGIMRHWYCQETPLSIDIDEQQAELQEFICQNIENERLSINLFDYKTRVDVPTVGAVAKSSDAAFPTFVHGSGSHLNPKAAIRQAAIEASQGLPYVHQLLLDQEGTDIQAEGDGLDENVLYYSLPRNAEETRFYFEGESRLVADLYSLDECSGEDQMSTREEYERLLEELAAADVTPIAIDITSRDAHQLGLRVTKVIIPELVPICNPAVPPTTHPSLEDDIETKRPHPFP